MASLAGALQALHQAGFVHRDFKSNHVRFSEGIPKVADFGLACPMNHQTPEGILVGTPLYMAPEQVAGSAASASFDIHAMGVVLYELLTGQSPWKGTTPIDVIKQIMTTAPAPPRSLRPSVPAELERICLKCLEKKPERRYPSAAALAEDLQRFLQEEQIGGNKRSQGGWRRWFGRPL